MDGLRSHRAESRRPLHLALLLVVLGSGCFDFDQRLDSCRDGGVWSCGATDGGPNAGDAGQADGGPTQSTAGLVCNRGWCWDHPRPTGINLTSVWGSSASDVWVGGELGTLIHFDGTRWTSHARDARYDISSICGRGSTVYVGAGTTEAPGLNRLMSWNGAWSDVPGTTEDINHLVCGTNGLWVARDWGSSRLDWSSGVFTSRFTLSGFEEKCNAIAETGPESCVVASMGLGIGAPFVRLRDCSGGLAYEVVDDAGVRGGNFGVRTLWVDPSRGLLAGLTGSPSYVWQETAGWNPVWTSNGVDNQDLYASAAYATGSLVVGAGGTVLDFTNDGGITQRVVPTSGNSYLKGMWSPPSGDAWVVGERGCIMERDAGTWVRRSPCHVGFEDFVSEPALAAVTVDGLYLRRDEQWERVQGLEFGQLALWGYPDGGFAHLKRDRLFGRQGALPTAFDDATGMYVVSEDRVVISRESGGLLDTNLRDGAASTFDAGVAILSLSGEPDGTVWATGQAGAVFRSSSAGSWTREDLGFTGDVDELATGLGRQWVVSGNKVATRPLGGAWTTHTLAEGVFFRVVPLDADNALLLRDTEAAVKVSSSFVVRRAEPPPTLLRGRIVRRGDELWAVGWTEGGIVRLPLAP